MKILVKVLLCSYGIFPISAQQFLFAQSNNPVLFQAGVINTGEYESHPAFSPTGDTLYFLKCTPDINNFCAICVSDLRNGKWSTPTIVPFSGHYYDIDPFVSADGKWLYFCSTRPVRKNEEKKSDTDIWRVSIASSGFGNPEHLSNPVNSGYDEYYPTLSDKGNLYFGSARPGKGGSDILRSATVNGKFLPPENLGDSINSENNEYEAFIALDESYLIYMATRQGGLSTADFYLSYNNQGQWSKAIKLPAPVNSAFTEWSPKITRDNKYFFFSSTRSTVSDMIKALGLNELKSKLNSPGNGLGDIYFIDPFFLKHSDDSRKKTNPQRP